MRVSSTTSKCRMEPSAACSLVPSTGGEARARCTEAVAGPYRQAGSGERTPATEDRRRGRVGRGRSTKARRAPEGRNLEGPTADSGPGSGSRTAPLVAARAVRQGARQAAVPLVPLLVVSLGDPERPGRRDLRRDRITQALLGLLARRRRFLLLLGPKGENGRSVLRPAIGALRVSAGRIVRLPEEVQQLRVGNLRRIELDQHRLGVAGGPAAHFLVGRIRGLPAGVAYRRRDDTWDFAQPLLYAPETALSEDGQLVLAGR